MDRESVSQHWTPERNVLESGCQRCPNLVESRTRIAWGTGNTSAEVMVVGEAPAAGNPDADIWKGGNHTGRAYTSRHSGRRIRHLIAELDYTGRVYYTNAVKCYPSDGDGSNREPTDTELVNCRAHLKTEIETIEPAVVLATGKHATRTLVQLEDHQVDSFLDSVCEPIECRRLGITVLPVLHPAYQEVWLSRLGWKCSEYRERIADHLP